MKARLIMTGPRLAGLQKGASLIEVLVAILVLAIGLLGMAALQATTLRNGQSARERTQAVMQTYAIIDAMRANRDVAIAGGYNRSLPASGDACTHPSGTSQAAADISTWLASFNTTMGEAACGAISCGTNAVCTVTIRWNDERGTGGIAEQQFVTGVML